MWRSYGPWCLRPQKKFWSHRLCTPLGLFLLSSEVCRSRLLFFPSLHCHIFLKIIRQWLVSRSSGFLANFIPTQDTAFQQCNEFLSHTDSEGVYNFAYRSAEVSGNSFLFYTGTFFFVAQCFCSHRCTDGRGSQPCRTTVCASLHRAVVADPPEQMLHRGPVFYTCRGRK